MNNSPFPVIYSDSFWPASRQRSLHKLLSLTQRLCPEQRAQRTLARFVRLERAGCATGSRDDQIMAEGGLPTVLTRTSKPDPDWGSGKPDNDYGTPQVDFEKYMSNCCHQKQSRLD